MYIYRAKNKNEIIYIGITNNMKRRMDQHSKTSEWYGNHDTIEYAKLPNRFSAKTIEAYLIKKYNPRFNKMEKNGDDIAMVDVDENSIKWAAFYHEPVSKKVHSGKEEFRIGIIDVIEYAILTGITAMILYAVLI